MELDSKAWGKSAGLPPEIYEQMGREGDRLARVVNVWTACANCKSETGARIEFVEDSDAFLEVYCKDCGVTADRGITNPPVTWSVPRGEEGQARGNPPRESLSGRVLHFWWAARNAVERSFS